MEKRDARSISFLEWVSEIAENLPDDRFGVFLMICAALWEARNAKLWENGATLRMFVLPEQCNDGRNLFIKIPWRAMILGPERRLFQDGLPHLQDALN
ncbi:unnamed protein product [Malus baccata var. baccata]